MEFIGVSFHVGSGVGDVGRYREAMEIARRVVERINREGGKWWVGDIGGGFPGWGGEGVGIGGIAKSVEVR